MIADLSEWQSDHAPASGVEIELIESYLGWPLPSQYKDFMLTNGSGEGFVGDGYLVLWPLGSLVINNIDYGVEKTIPGVFAFGGTGGGDAFAFDSRKIPIEIVLFPLIGMDADQMVQIGSDLGDVFEFLLKPR